MPVTLPNGQEVITPLEVAKIEGEALLPEFLRKQYYLSRPPWETGILAHDITITYDDGETPDITFPKGQSCVRINRERHAAQIMTAYQVQGSDPFRTFVRMGTLILPINESNWMLYGDSETWDELFDPQKGGLSFIPQHNAHELPDSWATILNIAHPPE